MSDRRQKAVKKAAIIAKTGRLEALDGHGDISGVLKEASGVKWKCIFKQKHFLKLKNAWMNQIMVSGRAVKKGQARIFNVISLEIMDSMKRANERMMKAPALSSLARMQHVRPARDLDAIGDLWPVDDDPDGLAEFIRREREAQRELEKDECAR